MQFIHDLLSYSDQFYYLNGYWTTYLCPYLQVKKWIYPILMNLEFFPQKWMKSAVDRNFQPVVACDVHGRQDEEDFAQQSNGRAEGIGSQKVR